jgi:hypothetical protein
MLQSSKPSLAIVLPLTSAVFAGRPVLIDKTLWPFFAQHHFRSWHTLNTPARLDALSPILTLPYHFTRFPAHALLPRLFRLHLNHLPGPRRHTGQTVLSLAPYAGKTGIRHHTHSE